MEELFIETNNGVLPIDQKIVQKFSLKKGTLSPFTNCRIVNKNGDFSIDTPSIEESRRIDEAQDDSIVELDNGIMLSTSEIYDISHGTDSSTEYHLEHDE